LLIRTTHYSLPEHLHQHIELVQPTTYFGRPKPMNTNLFIDALGISLTISTTPQSSPPGTLMDPYLGVNCTNITTVWCLQKLYNTYDYTPSATGKNKIGITGYLGQFANQADLQSFYKAERSQAVGSSFKTVLVNGAYNLRLMAQQVRLGLTLFCAMRGNRWAE
jgi:tripeptidyl-peptidase-1